MKIFKEMCENKENIGVSNGLLPKIMATCPYCLHVEYYNESSIKRKGKKGEAVIECCKCHAEFKLGGK